MDSQVIRPIEASIVASLRCVEVVLHPAGTRQAFVRYKISLQFIPAAQELKWQPVGIKLFSYCVK